MGTCRGPKKGAVAQLGERLICTQEVAGSNPTSSTKHVRNWSYSVLAREVRANLVYRQFTRIGMHQAPHAKTIGKLGLLLGLAVAQQLHQRIVAQAQAEKVIRGRKLRVDTTVVETNMHHPTDSA